MTKKDDKALAEKIKQLRLRLGLTQEQFAGKVCVTFSTVNRWEQGRSKPSPLATGRLLELWPESGLDELDR
ncbi:MAG: XRE family transcriptional regulator [Planctomycetes bacterium]|nr:XRE family transcriptional regulator [Planctomycetota bacterium]NOG53319.1 helix-turn-helix transcriptional regulator [Planctomycetota bacterium]